MRLFKAVLKELTSRLMEEGFIGVIEEVSFKMYFSWSESDE
jgi:hypothetical protein